MAPGTPGGCPAGLILLHVKRRQSRGGNIQLSMHWLLSTLVAGFVAFTLTDIDDLLLLIFFFSQTKKIFTKREVFFGQYLGFLFLLILTTIGYFGLLVITLHCVGLIGLVTFFMSLYCFY